MRLQPMTEAIRMSLNDQQQEMRENIGNKAYWERRWIEDPDSVCADLMALYTVTGKETQKIIAELVTEKMKRIDELNDVWTVNMQNLVDLVKGLQAEFREEKFRRKQDVERIDKHERQIKSLEHNMATMSLDLKHVGLSTQDLPKRLNNIESMITTLVDHAIGSNAREKAKPQSKLQIALSSVPSLAWVLIGVGVVLGIIYAFTGDASLLVKLGIGK